MNRLDDGVWPTISLAEDPWWEPWPDDDLGYADHVRCPLVPTRSLDAYRDAALALQEALDRSERGAHQTSSWAALAEAAAIPPRVRCDRRPVLVAPHLLSEREACLESLDSVPDAGQRAAHAILGPWRLVWSPSSQSLAWMYALAHWSMSGVERSPIRTWTRSKHGPDADGRAAARAVWQAPLSVWSIERVAGGVRVTDRVGIDPRRIPDGPVSLDPVRTAGDVSVPGARILGRMVPTEQGWHAWAPIVLPEPVSDASLTRIHHRGVLRLRLRNRRASVEDVLRGSGDWFARQVLTESFVRAGLRSGSRPV